MAVILIAFGLSNPNGYLLAALFFSLLATLEIVFSVSENAQNHAHEAVLETEVLRGLQDSDKRAKETPQTAIVDAPK